MTKRKIPRKRDARVTYTPQQTQRYKSQWSRYQKGLAIAAENAVHEIDDETYRIPSVRAPNEYWEVLAKQGGKINVTWEGKELSKGEINVTWEGKKPDTSVLRVTWEGRKCKEKPNLSDNPNWFKPLDLSGCYPRWAMWIAIPYKRVRFDNDGAWEYRREASSISEFLQKFRTYYPESNATDEDILIASEGGGWYYSFEYGLIIPGFHVGVAFNLDGTPDYSPGWYYEEVEYRCSRVAIDVRAPVYDGQTIINSLKSAFEITDDITVVKIEPPDTYSENCDLLDFNTNPPGEPPSCTRGASPTTWQCVYSLASEEVGLTWQILDPNGLIRAYSNLTLNYVYKSISPCPPPQSVDNIRLIQINGEEIVEGKIVDWDCTYTLEQNEFSENWIIVDDTEGIIQNDQDYQKNTEPCASPVTETLENVKLKSINFVEVTKEGEIIDWDCTYPLEQNEFSENWVIVGNTEGIIQNDNNYQKQLSPCEAPQLVENHKLIQINSVEIGEGYKCTCPDFAKKEGAFNPPAYPSMSQERNWESSDAGAPTWSDGKRRCCHIVAVQQVRKEDIPVPEDMPLGEA